MNIGAVVASIMTVRKIGVIAEDLSDIAVIKKLLEKRINSHKFSVKHFVGNGCGSLVRKCCPWARNLLARGCHHLILMHDLDSKDHQTLRSKLEAVVAQTDFDSTVVVIPVREVEAWMLADARAIQLVFRISSLPRITRDTESIEDPKRYLKNKVWQVCKKKYLNTVHNEKIAEQARLSELRRCPSFVVLDNFFRNI